MSIFGNSNQDSLVGIGSPRIVQWGKNSDENNSWIEEYTKWRDLKPHQLRILNQPCKTQSQAWLYNQMWTEWQSIKKDKIANENIQIEEKNEETNLVFKEEKK